MRGSRLCHLADLCTSLVADIAHAPDSKSWFVALSGGADSTALLHVLSQIAQRHKASLTALIVNHNLREDAAQEAELVAQRCHDRQIDSVILTISQTAPKSGRQEWARAQRYALLCDHVRRHGGVLWLGHHMHDQQETIAMRLARDSGLAGLSAMRPTHHRDGVYVLRPFLTVPKSDLIAICQSQNILFVADPSNENRAFERVRWRQILDHDRPLAGMLTRMGLVSGAIATSVADAIKPFFTHHVSYSWSQLSVMIDKKAFHTLPETARLLVLRHLLVHIGHHHYPPSFASVRNILQTDKGTEQTVTSTLAGCLIRQSADSVMIFPEAGRPHAPLFVQAGKTICYRGRFIIYTPHDIMVHPLCDRRLSSLSQDNHYRADLMRYGKEERLIFPLPVALDETPITPHIKDVVHMGYLSQLDWSDDEVAIYPLGRLAMTHM